MKELSIEEKSKRYDEALERAKIYSFDYPIEVVQDIITDIFPELKESETCKNKRVSKEISQFLKQNNGWDREWLDWLEKQGESNPYSGVSFNYNNNTFGMCARDGGVEILIDGNLKAFISLDNSYIYPINSKPTFVPKSALESVKEEKVDNQNCVKTTDKGEPEHLLPQKCMYYNCIKDYYSSDNTHLYVKGHVYKYFFDGYINNESHFALSLVNSCVKKYFEPTKDEDWIVCEHDNVMSKPMQYKEFKKEVTQKIIKNLEDKEITPKLRLWTIEDAEDGDVLADKYNNIGIFQECEGICWHSYIYLGCDGELQGFNIGGSHEQTNAYPATKEQCDLLFKKIKEDGYEWDAENKKLNKIGPKFHEGEWVIINGFVLKIQEISDDLYETIFQNDEVRVFDISVIDNEAHLWTIEDAKDGDVLVASDNSIFIFSHCRDNACVHHVALEVKDRTIDINSKLERCWETIRGVCPATKEQRDILFKAMTDAGYTFDFEKKELKEIKKK